MNGHSTHRQLRHTNVFALEAVRRQRRAPAEYRICGGAGLNGAWRVVGTAGTLPLLRTLPLKMDSRLDETRVYLKAAAHVHGWDQVAHAMTGATWTVAAFFCLWPPGECRARFR